MYSTIKINSEGDSKLSPKGHRIRVLNLLRQVCPDRRSRVDQREFLRIATDKRRNLGLNRNQVSNALTALERHQFISRQ